MEQEKQWYVVYTKAEQENKVCELLRRKKLDSFYPINKTIKISYGREKVLYKPLLDRYVFVYLSLEEIDLIKQIDNILNFVHWLAKPVIVSQEDVYLLKRFFIKYKDIHIKKTKVKVSEPAYISTQFLDDNNDYVHFSLPVLGCEMTSTESKTKVKVITVPNHTTKTNYLNKYAEAR